MASVKEIENVRKRLVRSARINSHRVHIISRESGWAVFMEGNVKATAVFEKKEKAVALAREMVRMGKASMVVVHDEHGKVLEG